MAARHEIRAPAWIRTAAFRIAAGEMTRRSDRVESVDVPAPDGVDTASLVDLIHALGRVSDAAACPHSLQTDLRRPTWGDVHGSGEDAAVPVRVRK